MDPASDVHELASLFRPVRMLEQQHSSFRLSFFFVISDQPEFNQIDQILLKQSHTAAVTFILEAVKQNADQSTIRYETAHRAFTVHPVCRWWL